MQSIVMCSVSRSLASYSRVTDWSTCSKCRSSSQNYCRSFYPCAVLRGTSIFIDGTNTSRVAARRTFGSLLCLSHSPPQAIKTATMLDANKEKAQQIRYWTFVVFCVILVIALPGRSFVLFRSKAAIAGQVDDYVQFRKSYCPWCNSWDPLCKRAFLFVIATGRSGSTTILGMVNGIPGVFLSGENWNEASRLRQFYSSRGAIMAARHDYLVPLQDWVWETNRPRFRARPLALVGFKEIRWTVADVAFMRQVCPCSRFIVNTRRNVSQQASSAFYRSRTKNPIQDVLERNDTITHAISVIPSEQVYPLSLEEFSVSTFNRLARWLGFSCRFQALIHSNANGSYKAIERANCNPLARIIREHANRI